MPGAAAASRCSTRGHVAHDRHLQEVADLVDRVVEAWGEERLGELWADLQADGIAFYRATYGPDQPWPASAERLIQVAIEGMHGHLGGPVAARRGGGRRSTTTASR